MLTRVLLLVIMNIKQYSHVTLYRGMAGHGLGGQVIVAVGAVQEGVPSLGWVL